MLIDSLVLSHINYALPACGPMLANSSLQWLQRLLNWGVRITVGMRKYDHIFSHRARLRWLPVESQLFLVLNIVIPPDLQNDLLIFVAAD